MHTVEAVFSTSFTGLEGWFTSKERGTSGHATVTGRATTTCHAGQSTRPAETVLGSMSGPGGGRKRRPCTAMSPYT